MNELIPKTVRYEGIRYEFDRKIKKNMYMYKGILNGCKICFSEYDLGLNKKINYNSTKGNCTNYRKGF